MEHEHAVIELTLSQLFVKDKALHKRGHEGQVVATHNFTDIVSLRVVQERDKSIFVGAAVFGALAIAAKVWIPSALWGWIAFVPLLLIALVLCLGGTSSTAYLEITTKYGTTRYSLDDPQEDYDGFLLTLRKLMAEAKQR